MGHFIRSPGPNADISLRVCADICRAAFFIPPHGWKLGDENGEAVEDYGINGCEEEEIKRGHDIGECPLRAVARNAADELYVRYLIQILFFSF